MFRRTKKLALIAASALLAFATGVDAQANVGGTYTWEFEAMIRRGPEGESSGGAKAQATLKLEVKGDSIFGTYQVNMPGMGEGRPRDVRGTVKGNQVQWIMTSQARFNVNGEERTQETKSIYTATIEGDVIKGTVETDTGMPGMSVSPRPFEGKRQGR